MLVDMFLMLESFGIFLFLTVYSNLLNLNRESRIFVLFMTAFLFAYLAFSALNLESNWCGLDTTNAYKCTTTSIYSSPDLSIVIFQVFFLAITLLNIFTLIFRKGPGE